MAVEKVDFTTEKNTLGGDKMSSVNSSDSLFEVLETIAPLHIKDHPDWIITTFGEKLVLGGREMQLVDAKNGLGLTRVYTADLSAVNLTVKDKPTQRITGFNYLEKYEIGGKEMIMACAADRDSSVLLYTADWSEVRIKGHPKQKITYFDQYEQEIGGKKIRGCKINHNDDISYVFVEDLSKVTIKDKPQKKITKFENRTVKISGREIIHCEINDTDERVRLDTKDFSEASPIIVKDNPELEITGFLQAAEIGGKILQRVTVNDEKNIWIDTKDCSEANLTVKNEPTKKITDYKKKMEILGKKLQGVTINNQVWSWVDTEDLTEVPLTVKDHPELKITNIDELREIGGLQRFAINYDLRIRLHKKDLQAVTLPGIPGYVHTIEHAEGHPGALYISIGDNKYLVKPKK